MYYTSVFFMKDVGGCRDDYYNTIEGDCSISATWGMQNIQAAYRLVEKITLNSLNLFTLFLKRKGRLAILWVQGRNQEIPILKYGMKKIL